MRNFLGLLILLLLVGCASTPEETTPEIKVEPLLVRQFVPLDPKLVVPCAIAEGKLSEILDIAKARKVSLEECNNRLEQIRNLQRCSNLDALESPTERRRLTRLCEEHLQKIQELTTEI